MKRVCGRLEVKGWIAYEQSDGSTETAGANAAAQTRGDGANVSNESRLGTTRAEPERSAKRLA